MGYAWYPRPTRRQRLQAALLVASLYVSDILDAADVLDNLTNPLF